jgi:demethylmenaquinone methyltransferase/2-methoxy-6-polyprenyl-1,4-benzoquinol methylase
MVNKYYAPGEQRSARVGDLFARIAPRYDLINDLQSFGLHRWWKRRVVKLANIQRGQRALDLCCGTGDVAFALARQGAEVVGLDFSEPMLEIARQRSHRHAPAAQGQSAAGNPQFIRGDAEQIPFPENSFDVVTISYGLRNLADWQRGLGEMWRVTKPGGRVLVLDFGKPANAVLRRIYFAYLRFVVPVFGKVFCGDAAAYAYILESLKVYPAQEGVAEKMAQMQSTDVRVHDLLGGIMSINYARRIGRTGVAPVSDLGKSESEKDSPPGGNRNQ